MLTPPPAAHRPSAPAINKLLSDLHLKENKIESLRKKLDIINMPRGHASPHQSCAKEKAEIKKLKAQLRSVQAAHDAAVENLLLAKNYVAAVADGHRPNGWNRYSYRRTGELPGGMVGNFKDFHINSEAAYLRQDEIEEELRKARPEDGVGRLGNNELVDEINRKKLDLRDCEERIQAVNLEHDVKLARVAKERDEWKARAERVEVQKGEVVKQTTELLNDTEKHLQDRKSLEDTIFQLRSVKGSGKGVLKKLESAEKNHADQSELIEEDTSRLIILTDRLVELQDELDRANARVQELEAQLREDKEIEIRRAELRELQNLIITREEQIAESNTREQDLRRRIQEYETRLSAVVIENSSEENRLLVAEINNLQDKLAQTLPLRTRENTQREVDQLNIDYDFCRAKLSCCDGSTQLGKLNAQMIVLEDEIGWLKRVITRHREELGGKIDRLEQELAEVRKQSAIAMAGGNNTSREKLIAVRDAFNMYHDEHAVDETHDDKLIHQIREMGVELAICREERDRAEADKAQLQAESEQLQDEVNDLQGANVRLENDKAQLQAENEQLEDEVNALQAEHASIDVDEMEIDNTMLQSQVAELKSQLAIATDVIAENIYKASGYEEQSAADEANTEHIARIETQVEEIARYQQQIADLEQRIVALPSDADFQDIQDQLNNSTARMVEIQAQGQTSDIGEELIRVQHEVTRLSGQEQRAKILVRERDRALQLRTKAEESWKEAQFQLQITRTERDSMVGESPSQGIRRIRQRIAAQSKETREANRRMREGDRLNSNAVEVSQVDGPKLSPRRLRRRSETHSVTDGKLTEAVQNKLASRIKRPSIIGSDSGVNSSKVPAKRRGPANSTVQATKIEQRKSIKEKSIPTKKASQVRGSALKESAESTVPISPKGPKKKATHKKKAPAKAPTTPTSPKSGFKRPPPPKRTIETRRVPLLSLFRNTGGVEDSANDEDFIPNPNDEYSSDDQLSVATSDDAVLNANLEPEADDTKPRGKSKAAVTKVRPPDLDLTKKKKKRVRFDDNTWRPIKGGQEDEDEDEPTPRTAEILLESDTVKVVSPSSLGRAKRERKRTAKAIDNSESQPPKKRKTRWKM